MRRTLPSEHGGDINDPPMTLEVMMFLLLPLIGGLLLGWLAPRRVAIPVEIVFFLVGALIFVLSAPDHDATYADSVLICIPAALVCVGVTAFGMWLRGRRRVTA
jgi:hypothetical protein